MKLIQQAWKISAKELSEPWHYNDIIVYAKGRGEAKTKGLTELINLGAEKLKEYKYDDTDLHYIDIKAKRIKDHDIISFEDEEMKRYNMDEYLWCKERDQKALDLTISNPNDLAVVYAGCYGQYWGANNSGYSSSIVYAGKYSTQEAYKIVKGSSYGRKETAELVNITEFNLKLDKQIEEKQEEINRLKFYKI